MIPIDLFVSKRLAQELGISHESYPRPWLQSLETTDGIVSRRADPDYLRSAEVGGASPVRLSTDDDRSVAADKSGVAASVRIG